MLKRTIWIKFLTISLIQKLFCPRFGTNIVSRAGRLLFTYAHIKSFFGGALAGVALLFLLYGVELRRFDGSYYVVFTQRNTIARVEAAEGSGSAIISPSLSSSEVNASPLPALSSAMPVITQESQIPDPVIPKPVTPIRPNVVAQKQNKAVDSQTVVAQAESNVVPSGSFNSPLRNPPKKLITTGFRNSHPGVDMATDFGTPVYSVKDGEVKSVGSTIWAYGNVVYIDHGDGYVSLYAHLSRINVSVGQKVTAGTVIGGVGSSGNSTGPHVHLEIHKNGSPINPYSVAPNL